MHLTENTADARQEGQTIEDIGFILWPHDCSDRIAAVLMAYFDESWDQKQEKIFVIGGMVGRYEQWQKIERPWKDLLDKYELEYYRASEAEFARGQFDKEPFRTEGLGTTAEQFKLLSHVRSEFFEVLTCGMVSGIAIGVPLADFREVANTPERLKKFGGTPYYICGHTAMLSMLKAQKYGLGSKELMAFVFDTHQDFDTEMLKVHAYMRTPACEFHSQVGSISFDDKKRFIPLQVADTLAYECRKDLERKMANPLATERLEFTRLKEKRKIFEITLCEKKALQWYLDNSSEEQTKNF